MTHCGHEQHREHRHRRRDFDRAGSAAEDFARRIARDAQRFGERVAEHATEFARNVRREWEHGPGFDTTPISKDVQGMLKEVRSLVADVIDGVDDLIGRIFHPEDEEPERWAKVVTNHEVTCAGCGRTVGAGEECHLLRRRDTRAFRCVQCGPLQASEPPPPPPPPNA